MTSTSLKRGTMLRHDTYRIERILGQGGFGITYLATDLSLDRLVAIKEFFPKDYCDRVGDTSQISLGTSSSADFVSRLKAKFLKEARNIAKLDHHGIIKIHAAFEENNTAYYVMDFIDGESLSDKVKREGPLSINRALEYIKKVANALDYIHRQKINHLDLKPANIMIRRSDDSPILIDFGLSKQYDSEGNQTSTTPTGISHGYAPLEQYNDGGVKEFSPQTDIYSLAATLFYLLTGKTPPHATKLIENGIKFPKEFPDSLKSVVNIGMASARKTRFNSINLFIESINNQLGENTTLDCDKHCNGTIEQGDAVMRDNENNNQHEAKPIYKKKLKKYLWLGIGIITIMVCVFGLSLLVNKGRTTVTYGSSNGHDWVDLGLPSGIKWATCNVGASSPEEYGNYYAWGETTPKSEYSWDNYFDCLDSSFDCRDYNDNFRVYKGGNTQITPTSGHDTARENWGGLWRMPTLLEFKELTEKCEWAWNNRGGHNGYIVTGPNGNSIFLPVPGYRSDDSGHFYGTTPGDYFFFRDSKLNQKGSNAIPGQGFYWTSTRSPEGTFWAWQVHFADWAPGLFNNRIDRFIGCSIRPVMN